MSDFLADQIMKTAEPIGLHSAYDRQLLIDTANALKSNPWVRQVIQVRRVYDQGPADALELDCEYRAPVALVPWEDYYCLVDGQGIRLPEQYSADELPKIIFGPDGKVNVRIVQGARTPRRRKAAAGSATTWLGAWNWQDCWQDEILRSRFASST